MNVFDSVRSERYAAYHVDAVEFAAEMPDDSVHLSVYSPPFSALYVYSPSERDMGNVANHEEFAERYRFLVRELLRITKPGRVACVHCSDITTTKVQHGKIGLYDLPGLIREVHEEEGWTWAGRAALEPDPEDTLAGLPARVWVWKDPVVEMQRTKAHGLLYKTFRTDASRCRPGMADQLLVFRKEVPGGGPTPDPVIHDPNIYPVEWWQEAASPVWRTINQTNVLNVKAVRDMKDERHVCPLQLDFIERCVALYSNRGDTVFSPFMGIGSEGYVALKRGRRFIGSELKDIYFAAACKHLAEAEAFGSSDDLFAGVAA